MSTTATIELTELESRVLDVLKRAGNSVWESDVTKELFPEPKYPTGPDTEEKRELQRAYWQHHVNTYGIAKKMPVGDKWEEFKPTVELNYDRQVTRAYLNLQKKGLADESNNGYNTYAFYATEKGMKHDN